MIDVQKQLSEALEAMRVDDRDTARDRLAQLLRCVCLGDPLPMVRIVEDEDGEALLAVIDSDQPRDDDAAFENDDEIIGRPCGRRGCHQWIVDDSWQYEWCEACSSRQCEHGSDPTDCNQCCSESDRAYDEARERKAFR